MAVKLKTTLLNLQSKLQAGGRFASVSIGEPTDPPNDRHAAIILDRYENVSTTLTGTIERRRVIVRIYTRAFQEARAEPEFWLDEVAREFMEDVWGEFDLGTIVRNVEPLESRVDFGYQQIAQTWYRIADIRLAMIVDDSATFTP